MKKMNAAEQAKCVGNAALGSGDLDGALQHYSNGLNILDSCPITSSSDSHDSDGDGDVGRMLRLKAVLLANRALVRMRSEEFESALVDLDASIHADASYCKALLRRGKVLEELAGKCHSDDAVGQLAFLQRALQSYLAFSKQSETRRGAAVVPSVRRVRVACKIVQDRLADIRWLIDRVYVAICMTQRDDCEDIKDGMDSDAWRSDALPSWLVCGDSKSAVMRTACIKRLVSQFVEKPSERALVVQARIPLHLVRIGCCASAKTHVSSGYDVARKFAVDAFMAVNAMASAEQANESVVTLLRGMPTCGVERLLKVPSHGLNRKTDVELSVQAVRLVSRVALGSLVDPNIVSMVCKGLLHLLNATTEQFPVNPVNPENRFAGSIRQLSESDARIASEALRALSMIASASPQGRNICRRVALRPLLFSPLVREESTMQMLIVCLMGILGNAIARQSNDPYESANAKSDTVTSDSGDMDKASNAEQQFKDSLAEFINLPLLSNSTAVSSSAAVALVRVLQAHPELGAFILKHGSRSEPDEKNPHIRHLVSVPSLEKLLHMCSSECANVRAIAAQAVALGSTDSTIRNAVAESGNLYVFIDLLSSPMLEIRTQAALALAKLVSISDNVKDAVLADDEMVESMIEVLRRTDEQECTESSDVSDVVAVSRPRHLFCAGFGAGISRRRAIEVLAYLSVNIEAKRVIGTKRNGAHLKVLVSAVHALASGKSAPERSTLYGLMQLFCNLVTSSRDLEEKYGTEIEQLRRVATQSLQGGAKDTQDRAIRRAGDPKVIGIIRRLVAQHGGIAALNSAARALEQHSVSESAESASQSALPKSGEAQTDTTTVDISPTMVDTLADTMLKLASDVACRGFIVQQRGMRLLLRLRKYMSTSSSVATACSGRSSNNNNNNNNNNNSNNNNNNNNDECCLRVSLALARTCISVNPNMFPQGVVMSVIPVLVEFVRNAAHELHQFEALLALTNIASVDSITREKIMAHDGWRTIQTCLGSNNAQVQRAAVEALTNLTMCRSAIKRLCSSVGLLDVRLLIAFARCDDRCAQLAACGALAMASEHKEVCEHLHASEGFITFMALATSDDDAALSARVDAVISNMKRFDLFTPTQADRDVLSRSIQQPDESDNP